MKVLKCKKCGKMLAELKDGIGTTICCGEEMSVVKVGDTDGALEKHVPVVDICGNKVSVAVGSINHPMLDVHYIEWIAIETTNGRQRRKLIPGEEPKAEFLLSEGEEFICAYCYCNLHGLYKSN